MLGGIGQSPGGRAEIGGVLLALIEAADAAGYISSENQEMRRAFYIVYLLARSCS